jgi:L-seryl-tRNA(Ser) seleniumtransferase
MSGSPIVTVARGPKASLGDLPSVDQVLKLPGTLSLIERFGRTFVAREIRALLLKWRAGALENKPLPPLDAAAIVDALTAHIDTRLAPVLKPVFNLTGTVLHTNLGRAVLPEEAIAAVAAAMRAPSNLEFELDSGDRGDRDSLIEALVCELTGAEAATVVNNNAAAVLLTVAALASKRQVLVSRGELVEIGGAFRMPDVVKSAGARMIEVGTTNRTHARDYVSAINAKTALIMKVHTSNYVVTGFTAVVPEPELARIAHDAGIPLAVDLGSGSLVDLRAFGLPKEPTPQESIVAGADIVTFSGDKLLGGPQSGIIVGKAEFIRRIRKHPLKRALRVSKMTLGALAATLALYRHPEQLTRRLPTLRSLTRRRDEIEKLASKVAPAIQEALGGAFIVTSGVMQSQIGSGSLPIDVLPSAGVFIRPSNQGKGIGGRLKTLAASFRALPVPVIGRITDDTLVLDLRTLIDETEFVAQLRCLRQFVATP